MNRQVWPFSKVLWLTAKAHVQDIDILAIKGTPPNTLDAVIRIVPLPITTLPSFTTMSISRKPFSRNRISGSLANKDMRLPYFHESTWRGMPVALIN